MIKKGLFHLFCVFGLTFFAEAESFRLDEIRNFVGQSGEALFKGWVFDPSRKGNIQTNRVLQRQAIISIDANDLDIKLEDAEWVFKGGKDFDEFQAYFNSMTGFFNEGVYSRTRDFDGEAVSYGLPVFYYIRGKEGDSYLAGAIQTKLAAFTNGGGGGPNKKNQALFVNPKDWTSQQTAFNEQFCCSFFMPFSKTYRHLYNENSIPLEEKALHSELAFNGIYQYAFTNGGGSGISQELRDAFNIFSGYIFKKQSLDDVSPPVTVATWVLEGEDFIIQDEETKRWNEVFDTDKGFQYRIYPVTQDREKGNTSILYRSCLDFSGFHNMKMICNE